jgi:trimeric autotransporter adhesin
MQEQTTTKGKTAREKNPEAEALIQKGIHEKEKIIHTGFVAQEVEEAAKKIGYDFSGVNKPQNEHTPYGLRYSEFVVPLVKAVQELSQQNDDLKKQNEQLKSKLDKVEAALALQPQNIELGKNAKLEQNVPNPYSTSTTISYYLPANTHNAYINFYASNGAFLKSVKLSGSGNGTININANELPSGAYRYSLIIDGKVVETKQMVQAK